MTNIILVSGLPGSGKSTVSESLAEKLKLPLFSVDPIESSIIKSGINKSFETGLAAYLVAETLAWEQLKCNNSVIIDAVNSVKEARNIWKSLSEQTNSKLIIIECTLEEKIHKERIESRVRNMHGMSEISWEDVQKRRKEYLPWTEERLILNTAENFEISIEKVLKYIES